LDLITKIRSRRKKLQRELLSDQRNTFFREVDHDEVQQQLKGHGLSTYTYRKPKFDCELRTTMAHFFSLSADVPWFKAVCALSESCLQSDSVHCKDSPATDCSKIGISEENQCPFCLANDSLRISDKQHCFYSKGTLQTHVHRRHHAFTTSSLPVFCPYSECEA